MYAIGSLILVNNNSAKGFRKFFNNSIKFFTGANWTHGSVFVGSVSKVPSILEADTQVVVCPASETFEKEGMEYAIYEYTGLTSKEKQEIVGQLFKDFINKKYGYLQILYFVRRWFWTNKTVNFLLGWLPKLLKKPKDPRQWNNWFVNGIICTELTWWAMYNMAQKAKDKKLITWLEQWNSNNFDPRDQYETMLNFKDKFVLVKKNF